MNPPPDLAFWKQFAGLLFAQVTVATLLAWAITRWLRNGRARQWCWRTVFVLSGCWLMASALGVEHMIRTSDAVPAPERQVVIRNNLPVENALVEPRQVLSVVEESSAVSAETVAQAAAGPVGGRQSFGWEWACCSCCGWPLDNCSLPGIRGGWTAGSVQSWHHWSDARRNDLELAIECRCA